MLSNDTLRMELADMGHPERMADHVIRALGYSDPSIPVEDIARELGITEILKRETNGSFEGILVADASKDKGVIWINSASHHVRQRFTIAHEIAHFVLPRHNAKTQCVAADLTARAGTSERDKQETEANKFAAALLMPEAMFKRDLNALGALQLSHLISLAEKYDVSLESAAMRIVKFAEEPCAIVFSHKGRFRYAPRSKGFPRINLENGRRLPAHCQMLLSDIQQKQISAWFGTSLYNWTGVERYYNQDVLQAQHYDYGDGYRLGMLQFEDDVDLGMFENDPFE